MQPEPNNFTTEKNELQNARVSRLNSRDSLKS